MADRACPPERGTPDIGDEHPGGWRQDAPAAEVAALEEAGVVVDRVAVPPEDHPR
ncbi:hypothetical protein [Pseudonocardia dioxanivorans]|uniref:hypothetical protein n=1 Tax=Pseudonocardia dioxanivorans TaxID=240495 RepID=UPI00131A4EA2|nr:hypothetical protein [Pseudonocardia dioxanivorans]